jgi:FlaA1/EpsC-like NDP-sugar epimerase
VIVGSILVFALFGLYRHWTRYASQRDYLQIAQACLTATLAFVAYVAVVQPRLEFNGTRFTSVGVPASVLVLYGLLMLVFIGGSRFLVHMLYERPLRGFRARRDARSVIIVGAGDGGRLLLREILRNPELGYRPVGFVDDDPRKQHARIDRGVSVLGTTVELPRVLEDVEPDEVLIAVPSAPGTMRARVVAACRERGVPVRTMPTVFELLQTSGRLLRQVRDVRVEDVLGREPVHMDLDRVGGYLTGRVVLVTGAGGSIGSELCRQIARVGPSRLVLLDHAEDNLFAIRRELVEDRHVLNTVAVLADCKEGERMREVFAEHRPAIVFHAAAYKHVHLVEENPVEAVRNNAVATRLLCQVAGESGLHGFRARLDRQGGLAGDRDGRLQGARRVGRRGRRPALSGHFLLRRPLRQRARLLGLGRADLPAPDRGGRAGHRHPPRHDALFHDDSGGRPARDPRRSLVNGGEVFVLEMGEPVKIMELARDMIRLSGLEPERDIAIEVIGPRPGEKLHEELFNPYERPQQTPAQKILRATHPRLDPAWEQETFDQVGWLVLDGDAAALAEKVAELAAVRQVPPELDPSAATPVEQPAAGTAPRISGASIWSCSRSLSRARSRSTASTSASPPSSVWPCSRCCTSRRRVSSSACASGPAARLSVPASSRSASSPRPRRRPRRAPGGGGSDDGRQRAVAPAGRDAAGRAGRRRDDGDRAGGRQGRRARDERQRARGARGRRAGDGNGAAPPADGEATEQDADAPDPEAPAAVAAGETATAPPRRTRRGPARRRATRPRPLRPRRRRSRTRAARRPGPRTQAATRRRRSSPRPHRASRELRPTSPRRPSAPWPPAPATRPRRSRASRLRNASASRPARRRCRCARASPARRRPAAGHRAAHRRSLRDAPQPPRPRARAAPPARSRCSSGSPC